MVCINFPCPPNCVCRGQSTDPRKFRAASLNIGSLNQKEAEVVETLTRRRIDICSIQEHRLAGGTEDNQARVIAGKDSKYKLYWSGCQQGTGGVGILLAEKWVDKVYSVERFTDRIMLLRLIIGSVIFSFFSLYAPQAGLPEAQKESFYDQLQAATLTVPSAEMTFHLGDWNGHVGAAAGGYENVHGGRGYGERNTEGERILEFATANDLLIGNTLFIKRESHLVTYQSGAAKTQVDYALYSRKLRNAVTNVKVIPGEECASQHRLLVCDLRVQIPPAKQRKFLPRLRTWKLRDPVNITRLSETFRLKVATKVQHNRSPSAETAWSNLKTPLLEAVTEVCGFTRPHQRKRETWWWDDRVDAAIAEKRERFRAYNVLRVQGNPLEVEAAKDAYTAAKQVAKHIVEQAKSDAEAEVFKNLDPQGNDIYRIARQMDRTNQDIVGEKCIRNDNGDMAFSDKDKMKAWAEHYSRLLNVEFDWPSDLLPAVAPVAGPPPPVTAEKILDALGKMKTGKAAGPSGITAEMLKATGLDGVEMLRHLGEHIFNGDAIPTDWEESTILNLYKGKGDSLDRGNYRGLKLTEQPMKCLERVLYSAISSMVDIDGMQFGFMPGRGTIDAIFIVRQLQEKYHAAKKPLYFAFVDLEKAFDRVPRKVLWWAMRSLGVEEWAVRAVQSMYANARSRVRVNGQLSEEFEVKVGVHQGSVLSPLLFIMVLEALSREFRTGVPWELLYADDLVIIANSLEELIARFKAWKDGMEQKGLKVNIPKTVFMISGTGLDVLKDSGRYPCSVCREGVGANSIYCTGCARWVHKRCSGIRGRLIADPNYICPRCLGYARPVDRRPATEVTVDDSKMKVVGEFCYLGDMLSSGGGCTQAIIARCRVAWGKFKKLLPILTNKHLSLEARGRVFDACVRSALLHGSETWGPTVPDVQRLERADRAMVRWICGVKLSDRVPTTELYALLGLEEISSAVGTRRLRWYGHVCRSSGSIATVEKMEVKGNGGRGRPRKSWKECVRRDRKDRGMLNVDPTDRTLWRSAIYASRLLYTPP